jgi:hypothetical protein
LNIEYALEPRDYAAFATYHCTSRTRRHRGTWVRFGFPVLWMVLGIPGMFSGRSVFFGIFLIVMGIAWILFLPAWYRSSVRRSVHKTATEGLCRGSVGPHELCTTENGITITNRVMRSDVSWGGVEGVVEEPDYLYIYLGPNAAQVIPKRALTSEQARELVQIIRGHLVPAAA